MFGNTNNSWQTMFLCPLNKTFQNVSRFSITHEEHLFLLDYKNNKTTFDEQELFLFEFTKTFTAMFTKFSRKPS